MSTIGGLTGSTTSNIRGYGGLASGLDRDSLIEGMTMGTTNKITQQQKKKTQLEWKQSAVQNITNQMIAFANKYTSSWSSKTNLFSSVLWGRNQITTTGKNNKYVSVSGTATAADAITIMGVKQLAEKAKWTSSGQISDQTLSTGTVDATKNYDIYNLINTDIDFKIGNDTATGSAPVYTLKLDTEMKDKDGNVIDPYDYGDPKKAVEWINQRLADTEAGEKKLSDYVTAVEKDGKIGFVKKGGNSVSISGGTALSNLGFSEKKYDLSSDEANATFGEGDMNIVENVDFAKKIGGKSLTFSYNGKNANIKMPGEEELSGKNTQEALEIIKKSMQEQMNSAFGKGRVKVDISGDQLTFKTMDPSGTDKADTTSTLTLAGGDDDVKEALGLSTGASNRLDMNAKLLAEGEKKTITINGEYKIEVTDEDTRKTLIDKINASGANISITYQNVADKFTITSKEDGASGSFEITSDDKDFLSEIFGTKQDENGNYEEIKGRGQDAIVALKYAGSDEVVELIRDTNSFTVDGLTLNVKGEFGYNGDDVITDDPDTVVEMNAQVNTDSIVDAVKNMIEEYNSIVELVNKELTTKPDRDYEPLTSEQKKELSEDDIKLYEEKAKQGLLFADSDLRTLTSDLRFIIGGGIAQELADMGISTSSSYSDNGKITFDESKFRAALEKDPERVQELFTSSAIQNPNGNGTTKGVASVLRDVMDKYVNTMGSWDSKGILVRKAGTESSPVSLTENYMYKQIAEFNKAILKLQTQLEAERDRYIAQFSNLETLISQMNAQSSYLSGLSGY